MKVENITINNIIRFDSVGGRLGRDGIYFDLCTSTLGQKIKSKTTSTIKYICQQERSY